MKPPSDYLAAYPADLIEHVHQQIELGTLADRLRQKYPVAHQVRSDRALYEFTITIKDKYLRNSAALGRVAFDSTLHIKDNALGMHSRMSRVQGSHLKANREIRISAIFRQVPVEFLRMIVVHELAHLKESAHNKAFYQLCLHMEHDYHQFEFDLRVYLAWLDATGQALW